MLSGIPIAFALGAVALAFMVVFMPGASLDTVAQNVYEEMASITLLSIPLFILKGAAIGRSRAGQDLYSAMHAWMHRIPGGLGIANVFACALFAAMAVSSPATCSAIGSAGIRRCASAATRRASPPGSSRRRHARHPAAALDHHDPVRGRLRAIARALFLAGIGPGLLLVALFAAWGDVPVPLGILRRQGGGGARRPGLADPGDEQYSMAQRFSTLPRVLPFVVLLTGVMVALYGGYATPSETAGLGGLLALGLIAAIYGVWRFGTSARSWSRPCGNRPC